MIPAVAGPDAKGGQLASADCPHDQHTTNLFSLVPVGDGRVGRSEAALRVGCLVRTGQNLHPQFEVVALSGDKAWVREVQSGTDHVVPVERCQPVARSHSHRFRHAG